MTRSARLCAALVATAVAASGCASTVKGVAVRDVDANPTDVRPLREAQLDDVMLSIAQLNGIAGATQMEVVLSGERMSDNSDAVSDPDCLGSIFGAEDLVYQSSEWTAVRDQVAKEPREDNQHWMEQTAVLYPTEREAGAFVEDSTAAWKGCGGFSVAVDDGSTSSIWLIDDVRVDGDVVTQRVAQEDSDGWECQHAMSAVANLSVETIACAFGVNDEAVSMVSAMMANAARL
ncbi:sensor domain-containing protein [Mycolicibacterium sp. P1-18]|uniref:sensor domain-containing protein n=1 Tax=Mycolicibacterium sp. P1-18 TaxID=2024615 RepID=UPI0011F352DB|nr:sensor domain-containing protein [Mycolicibacterium sp. P1-18]KAA0094650.1 sensor domain-containing protein [Mycolicibacterium sp. P1-18]